MKEIECFALISTVVPSEDSSFLIARFSSEEAAKEARPAANEGGRGAVVRRERIVLYESASEFRPDLFDTEAKESGLGKLTDREKAALGLVE